MVLVVGATGLVGSEVCQKLIQRGEKVRALARKTSAKQKVEALRSAGAQICLGDLKDPPSITAACRNVDAVISTASATLSRQPGDTIETVDAAGQITLVNAAKAAGIERLVYISFRRSIGRSFPLGNAKRDVEKAMAGMNYTVIHASYFMEVWLSPVLGFDYKNATARVTGPGTSPVSWVSFRDVAEICALALAHPAAQRRAIEFGGPEPLTMLDVVARFEKIGKKRFQVEHIPERMLRAQFAEAKDSMQKSFAALMLGALAGDPMNMAPIIDEFGMKLASIDDYARSVLGSAPKQ